MNDLDNEKQNIIVIAINLSNAHGRDGNQYYYLRGKELNDGIAGFGDTDIEAALDFLNSLFLK